MASNLFNRNKKETSAYAGDVNKKTENSLIANASHKFNSGLSALYSYAAKAGAAIASGFSKTNAKPAEVAANGDVIGAVSATENYNATEKKVSPTIAKILAQEKKSPQSFVEVSVTPSPQPGRAM